MATAYAAGLTVTQQQQADAGRLKQAAYHLSAAYSALPLWASYARQDIQAARDAVSRAEQAVSGQDDAALEFVG